MVKPANYHFTGGIMNYITIVIEYADGQEMPSFTANMPLLGGTITAVQFNDALAELEELQNV